MGCCLAAGMACFSLGINKLKTTYENSPTRNITNMQTHGTNACMVTMLTTKTGRVSRAEVCSILPLKPAFPVRMLPHQGSMFP